MAFHVRDEATDMAVRRLAKVTGKGLTGAIRLAVDNELERRGEKLSLRERLEPIIRKINDREYPPPTQTDKEFWDDMCGDP